MLIIHFLNREPKLYYCNNLVLSDVLVIDNISYIMDDNSKRNQGFIGFFDWLRVDKSTIIGIRICCFEHQSYNQILEQFSYVTPTFENQCMELLFNGGDYNADISSDQDFTNNYVYESDAGDYLFTFGLDHLTEREVSSFLGYCEVINEAELRNRKGGRLDGI